MVNRVHTVGNPTARGSGSGVPWAGIRSWSDPRSDRNKVLPVRVFTTWKSRMERCSSEKMR